MSPKSNECKPCEINGKVGLPVICHPAKVQCAASPFCKHRKMRCDHPKWNELHPCKKFDQLCHDKECRPDDPPKGQGWAECALHSFVGTKLDQENCPDCTGLAAPKEEGWEEEAVNIVTMWTLNGSEVIEYRAADRRLLVEAIRSAISAAEHRAEAKAKCDHLGLDLSEYENHGRREYERGADAMLGRCRSGIEAVGHCENCLGAWTNAPCIAPDCFCHKALASLPNQETT